MCGSDVILETVVWRDNLRANDEVLYEGDVTERRMLSLDPRYLALLCGLDVSTYASTCVWTCVWTYARACAWTGAWAHAWTYLCVLFAGYQYTQQPTVRQVGQPL